MCELRLDPYEQVIMMEALKIWAAVQQIELDNEMTCEEPNNPDIYAREEMIARCLALEQELEAKRRV